MKSHGLFSYFDKCSQFHLKEIGILDCGHNLWKSRWSSVYVCVCVCLCLPLYLRVLVGVGVWSENILIPETISS